MSIDNITEEEWYEQWRKCLAEKEKEDWNNQWTVADPVNQPPHYNTGGIECIEAIEASMTSEEFKGYLRGNVQKYVWRCMYKGKTLEDLKKAQWYLNRLIGVVGNDE
jgi:hypothetical protein